MKIEVPDATAEELRAMLARHGEETDVESYVQRTLAKRLLAETVGAIHEFNRDVDPGEIGAAVDEALAAVREERRE